ASRLLTSVTTWHWRGGRSLSSPMMPSHAFTVFLTDFPGRSTTPPPRRSSPLPQTTRISSTTPVRKGPPPSSPGTDRAHGRGERTAMVIEACRVVLTERCRLMCKQRGRQQPDLDPARLARTKELMIESVPDCLV